MGINYDIYNRAIDIIGEEESLQRLKMTDVLKRLIRRYLK